MDKKDSIVTSTSGQRMMSYIPPLYDDDLYLLLAFQVMGLEVDDLRQWSEETREQAFPHLATWGLRYWEQRFGLEVNERLPIEYRRQRIITYMNTYFPITPLRMEEIASAAAGVPVTIEQNVADYVFRINLHGELDKISFDTLYSAVSEAKPAHLGFSAAPNIHEVIEISDRITTTLRRYHKVFEFKVGMKPMKYQSEVEL